MKKSVEQAQLHLDVLREGAINIFRVGGLQHFKRRVIIFLIFKGVNVELVKRGVYILRWVAFIENWAGGIWVFILYNNCLGRGGWKNKHFGVNLGNIGSSRS